MQPGENVWILTSACLVLFLAIPGQVLFYGALLRTRSVASLLAQSLGIACLVGILWWIFGYSFIFADGAGPIIGDFTRFAFLRRVNSALNTHYAFSGSQNVFCLYQLMFAIVTPVLIVVMIAGRVRFRLILLFITFWMVLVYFPLAHMVWGIDGLMNGAGNPKARIRAIDFGGGLVVQMAAGWSGLILFLILGKQRGAEEKTLSPRRLLFCLAGEAMLWIGWYGFNSGWAAATQSVAQAFTTTTIAALVASFAWTMADYRSEPKPDDLGFCYGAVAGLAAIAPASGFVSTTGAVVIGLSAGLIPVATRWAFKFWSRYEHSLEAFGVHVLGGMIGVFLTGLLASGQSGDASLTATDGAAGANGLAKLIAEGGLWMEQVKAIMITLLLAGVMSALLAFALKAARIDSGLRLKNCVSDT